VLIAVIFDENGTKMGKKAFFFGVKKGKNGCFWGKNGVKSVLISGFLGVFRGFFGIKVFQLFRVFHCIVVQ